MRFPIFWAGYTVSGMTTKAIRARSSPHAPRPTAQAARQALPASASQLEAAALAVLAGSGSAGPAAINSLDDLRLAGLLKMRLPVPPELLQGTDAGLAAAWAASLLELE